MTPKRIIGCQLSNVASDETMAAYPWIIAKTPKSSGPSARALKAKATNAQTVWTPLADPVSSMCPPA